MKTAPRGLLFGGLLLGLAAAFPVPASAQEFLGEWAGVGEGEISASIRRGRSNPDYLVATIETATRGCLGAVTVYGKLGGNTIPAESYDASDPGAPVCRIELEMVGSQALRITEIENCIYYHGAACGFSGNLTRR